MLNDVCLSQLESMSNRSRRNFLRDIAYLSGGLLVAASTAENEKGPRWRAEISMRGSRRPSVSLQAATTAHIDDLLVHLRDQWHVLVGTDNLLGPRHALPGVLDQLGVIDDLLTSATSSVDVRHRVVKLAAQYAESASWLFEDSGDLDEAVQWNNRAMEWAVEADDLPMLSWTLFRRSQQAIPTGNPAKVLSLAQTAGRPGDRLLPSMRAAIAQQEAHGHALNGDEISTMHRLDDAHLLAVTQADIEARSGHGAFCTPSYIELQRARCWLVLGRPERAVEVYRATIPQLPAVSLRDRGLALAGLASAYVAIDEPQEAGSVAVDALHIGQSTGSDRIVQEVYAVGGRAPAVGQLIDQLIDKP